MIDIKNYGRKIQYYETDRMGIVHHSNYIRWMEEARIDALAQIGIPYDKIEAAGISDSRSGRLPVNTGFPSDLGRSFPSACFRTGSVESR